MVVVGIPRDERIMFDLAIARRRELTFLFSRRSHGTLPEAVSLVAERTVDLRELPTRTFTLEQTAAALEMTGHPGAELRAIVAPQGV